MDTQTTLWGNEPIVARARKSDPVTSHEAAARVNRSGRADSNRARVLEAIRDIPGRTSAELAEALDMDRVEVARRCPELIRSGDARQGEKRKCRVNGTPAVTWFPVYQR